MLISYDINALITLLTTCVRYVRSGFRVRRRATNTKGHSEYSSPLRPLIVAYQTPVSFIVMPYVRLKDVNNAAILLAVQATTEDTSRHTIRNANISVTRVDPRELFRIAPVIEPWLNDYSLSRTDALARHYKDSKGACKPNFPKAPATQDTQGAGSSQPSDVQQRRTTLAPGTSQAQSYVCHAVQGGSIPPTLSSRQRLGGPGDRRYHPYRPQPVLGSAHSYAQAANFRDPNHPLPATAVPLSTRGLPVEPGMVPPPLPFPTAMTAGYPLNTHTQAGGNPYRTAFYLTRSQNPPLPSLGPHVPSQQMTIPQGVAPGPIGLGTSGMPTETFRFSTRHFNSFFTSRHPEGPEAVHHGPPQWLTPSRNIFSPVHVCSNPAGAAYGETISLLNTSHPAENPSFVPTRDFLRSAEPLPTPPRTPKRGEGVFSIRSYDQRGLAQGSDHYFQEATSSHPIPSQRHSGFASRLSQAMQESDFERRVRDLQTAESKTNIFSDDGDPVDTTPVVDPYKNLEFNMDLLGGEEDGFKPLDLDTMGLFENVIKAEEDDGGSDRRMIAPSV
jgi:hypothetical protein